FVQPCLTDDRVDRDRRFSGRAIADDQLALAAANWNHRVDRHDTGLHRLADAAALYHAGRDFFERVKCLRFDLTFAVERVSYGIDHATQQSFPYRNREQPAGRFCLVAFRYLGGVAEQNRTHLSFLEVKSKPENTAR